MTPNILLIMCDQLRADVLSCYGQTELHTPNIDRIAQMGVRFERAYSQTPVCMPARHSLIAGKNAFETGFLDNAQKNPIVDHPLAAVIRENGYYTCAVGKMHFVPVLEHYGFDKRYVSEEIPRHYDDDDYLKYLVNEGFSDVVEPHGHRSEQYYVPQISQLPEQYHNNTWVADRSIEVIRKNANRPFFLFSSFIKPHPPFEPTREYAQCCDGTEAPHEIIGHDDEKPVDDIISIQNGYKVNGYHRLTVQQRQQIRAHYYDCVIQLDRQIGRILDCLEEEHLLENTVILFTSDHGEMLGDHCSYGKRNYYESSARIPLLIAWKDHFKSGFSTDQFAVLPDLYATAVTLSGTDCDTAKQALTSSSGVNLVPILTNDFVQEFQYRQEIIGEFGWGRQFKCMLREGAFKYIYFANGGREQLFDLENDPEEKNNIASQRQDQCKKYRDRLYHYYTEKGLPEALGENSLKCYPYQPPEIGSYIDQYPHWQEYVR